LGRAWAERPVPPEVLWSLVDRVAAGEYDVDPSGHAEIWDATLGGEFGRAVVLHPPARLTCLIPGGGACRLTGFIGMHPEMHEHSESGPVQFQLTVDDRQRWTCLLDARLREEDRSWLPFAIDVPARATESHEVQLETRGIDGQRFRWALWRGLAASQPTFSSQKLQPKAGCTPR
jgi:hypothetical protein